MMTVWLLIMTLWTCTGNCQLQDKPAATRGPFYSDTECWIAYKELSITEDWNKGMRTYACKAQ